MKASTEATFGKFVRALGTRIEAGEREYGDASFGRPADRLLGEIEEELLDVAGWAFVLWIRLQRLRKAGEGEA